MKAHWWSCVWGLLCMPAEVILSTWTVSQEPLSISLVKVNSSTEIICSTSLSDPMGVYLHRGFHANGDVMFLDMENGQVTKNTIDAEFAGRIHVAPDQQIKEGYGFTWQLSLLRLEDTDWYYCRWMYFKSKAVEQETSKGTIIIVRESDPREQCKNHVGEVVFIALSVGAFTITLFLFVGALIVRRTQFKKSFRPARAVKTPRPNSPPHVCPQQRHQDIPYLFTSAKTLDFRGIL